MSTAKRSDIITFPKKLSQSERDQFCLLIEKMDIKKRNAFLLFIGDHPLYISLLWNIFTAKTKALQKHNTTQWKLIIETERATLKQIPSL